MSKKKEPTNISTGTVTRDETSKGEIWQYTDTQKSFKIEQKVKDSDTYIRINNPIAVKNGDGEVLVITKFLNKKTNKVTTITDTITNFNDDTTTITSNGNELTANFQYYENITGADSKVTGDWANLYETKKNTTYTIKDNAKSGTSTGSNVNVYDEKGADTYNLNGGLQSDTVYIRDFAGKDTYNVASTSGFNANKLPEIYDYLGNDKYNFGYLEGSKDAMAKVFDYKGNDTYKVTKTTNVVNVTDKAGNDKYEFDKATPNSNFKIDDEAGNDNYTIKDSDLSNESGKITITDNTGNDKYTLTKVINDTGRKTDITDNAGKDTYKITDSTNTYISDFNSTKDSYTATNSTNVTIIDGSNITGKTSGNDKYTFTNTKSYSALDYDGNENYTVLGGSGDLTDFAGNDKYKVTAKKDYDISKLTIADTKGKDSYTVSGAKATKTDEAVYVQKLTIKDNGEILKDSKGKDIKKSANDTYKLSYIDNSEVDYSTTASAISDKAGDDKYTIKNSKNIKIEDEEGKDSYNISGTAKSKKQATQIDFEKLAIIDANGNDTYKLSYIDNTSNDSYKITDKTGDDKYAIKNSNGIRIEDEAGKDKYTVSDSELINIADKGGNDTFTLKNVGSAYVLSSASTSKGDSSLEKNTFNLTNITEALNVSVNGEDPAFESIDTYNVSYKGTTKGQIYDYDTAGDKYNIKNTENFYTRDFGGSDKYSFTNSKNIRIVDSAASNKGDEVIENNIYTITNAQGNLEIKTNWDNYDFNKTPATGTKKDGVNKISKDTYNINFTDKENTAIIYDYDEADDIYNIKKSTKLDIQDAGGSDTYTVDKLTGKYSIADLNGDNDSLIISDKKANIIFMAESINDDKNALFAYDTKNKGFVKIDNYFKEGFEAGTGKIETIKVGKKELTVDASYIQTVQANEAVAQYISSNGGSIEAILSGSDNAVTVQNLVNYFDPKK